MVAYLLARPRLAPGLSQAGSGLPPPTPAADTAIGGGKGSGWPVAGSARLRQCDGLQATANGVSKRRPNFPRQLLSTQSVPEVGDDKAFRLQA